MTNGFVTPVCPGTTIVAFPHRRSTAQVRSKRLDLDAGDPRLEVHAQDTELPLSVGPDEAVGQAHSLIHQRPGGGGIRAFESPRPQAATAIRRIAHAFEVGLRRGVDQEALDRG